MYVSNIVSSVRVQWYLYITTIHYEQTHSETRYDQHHGDEDESRRELHHWPPFALVLEPSRDGY